MTPEVAAATRAVNAIDKSDVRRWLDASRSGDLAILRAMHAANPSTLHAWGKGTSLGFTGQLRDALGRREGPRGRHALAPLPGRLPDARNNADSTPSHSAAGAGQKEALRALLLEGGADASLRNGLDETAARRRCRETRRRRRTARRRHRPVRARRRSSRTNRTTRGGR